MGAKDLVSERADSGPELVSDWWKQDLAVGKPVSFLHVSKCTRHDCRGSVHPIFKFLGCRNFMKMGIQKKSLPSVNL